MSRYDRRLVEQLLAAIWDKDYAYGVENPTAPDPDIPKSKADPKTGNTLYAHLADIHTAWRRTPLTDRQRRALFMRYGLDWTHREIATHEAVDRSIITRRIEVAVGHLVTDLNGDKPEDLDRTATLTSGSDANP